MFAEPARNILETPELLSAVLTFSRETSLYVQSSSDSSPATPEGLYTIDINNSQFLLDESRRNAYNEDIFLYTPLKRPSSQQT